MERAKAIVDKAVRQHKIFVVFGQYNRWMMLMLIIKLMLMLMLMLMNMMAYQHIPTRWEYDDDGDDDDFDFSVKRALKRRGWLEKPCDCCPKLPRWPNHHHNMRIMMRIENDTNGNDKNSWNHLGCYYTYSAIFFAYFPNIHYWHLLTIIKMIILMIYQLSSREW